MPDPQRTITRDNKRWIRKMPALPPVQIARLVEADSIARLTYQLARRVRALTAIGATGVRRGDRTTSSSGMVTITMIIIAV
jgi:hypothetical protein